MGQVGITATVDTSQLIVELKNTLVADSAGRQIQWSIAPDFPLVTGDPASIRQVWSKLLTNALKYPIPCGYAHRDQLGIGRG